MLALKHVLRSQETTLQFLLEGLVLLLDHIVLADSRTYYHLTLDETQLAFACEQVQGRVGIIHLAVVVFIIPLGVLSVNQSQAGFLQIPLLSCNGILDFRFLIL